MAIRSIKSDNFDWYYLTDFSEVEANFLKSNFKFHPLDLKDCAGEVQRSKIDSYRNYLFMVIQFPELNGRKVSINQVYVFIGKKFLITIAKSKMKVLNNLFYKTLHNKKVKDDVFSDDPGYLLYKVLDSLLRFSWSIHPKLDADVRHIESEIYEGRGKKAVFDVAALRRVILQLKAIIDPQKIVTNTLSRLDASFLSKDMMVYFDDLDDFVEKNWLSLESHKERVSNLQEVNESLISYRTNQTMKVLTIFSVALMPLTLLSGIYGMNIDLPFSHSPIFVWILFATLALAIFGILFYFKKKDLI